MRATLSPAPFPLPTPATGRSGRLRALAYVSAALTARERADAARLAADLERRLQAQITENLVEAVCAIRWSDSQIVYANRRLETLFGFAPGTAVGCLANDVEVVGADRDRLNDECRTALAAGGAWSGELEYRRLDGTTFLGSATLSAFAHPDHGPLSVLVLADVTEQRAAERRLQDERRMLAESQAVGQIGSWESDPVGDYRRWSAEQFRLHGLCPGDGAPTLREYLDLVHPEDRDAVRRATDADGPYAVDYRFHRPGRGWCTLRARGDRLPAGAGRPARLAGTCQDVTAERLAHAAEEQFRRSFEDALIGMMILDLDGRFVQVNDALCRIVGRSRDELESVPRQEITHPDDRDAGDGLIVRIADALRGRLRESDVLARLGGDEFAVLLPLQDGAGARVAAEALAERVRQEAMPTTAGELRHVTASIGIACFEDGEGLTAEELLVNADLAMYDAKEEGRDRIALYRSEAHDRPRMESRMQWAEQITDAIANDGFELLAQPIVALSGATARPGAQADQFELLLRMREPGGDLIAPGSFLYVAERLGLIQSIDRWVTSRAIDLLAETRAAGHDLRLEVNLSGHTLGDPELLELVEQRLADTGVPADRLIFEVTETAAVAHIARAAAFADRLSELGCKFALGDFGAGFGSFYYLKHLPFDYLKIDGEFVRHCATNETDRILIASVVQIARGMGKQTIAEFVSSDETVDVLTRLGVDHGQGFHLGRPAPLGRHLGATPSRSA